MVLVAKTKAKPRTNKKRVGNHHRTSSSNYRKAYWPYLPMLLVVGLGLVLNSALNSKHSVLGYATDMSIPSLLQDTNIQRTSGGLAGLSLNSELNNAAQAKANDMAARNYWSHNSPTGQTPWSFILAAGYNYQLAGENLAYGFTTASYTITGWMNSPEHRANIMNGGYRDVGFGIINIANYQNEGPETLVVAMYGATADELANPAPAPTATPPATTPVASSTPKPTTTSTPLPDQPAATPTPVAPAVTTPVVKAAEPATLTPSKQQTSSPTEPQSQRISRIQLVADGKASWSILAATLIIASSFALLLVRHGYAWHKRLIRGEQFVLHHPLLDILVVTLVMAGVILSHTAGIVL